MLQCRILSLVMRKSFTFLFQEINSKEISEVFESNSLLVDMEQKVIHKGN